MRYPKLRETATVRQTVDVFRGYNHNLRIGDGEFFDMKNLTSDHYPVLAPRGQRGVYATPAKPTGMISKDALCYVDGSKFVIGGYPVEMGLSDEPKQLISMGAYVIILPDKKYINTLDTTDRGSIEHTYTSTGDVTFCLCTADGADYEHITVASTEPAEPQNLALWIDTSSRPHTLKQYSEASAVWMDIAATYVKLSCPGIGAGFRQYDGVNISGIGEPLGELNGAAVIWERGDDYIVISGMVDAVTAQRPEAGAVTVERTMPLMDFVTESDNRLWGCRYGLSATGQVVNEIYCSKLGDFRNWSCFMGLSTDSYAASVGTDGPFTGAVTHMGYPLFFKENCLHKVYGSYPANFQVQSTPCRGVQKGSHRSLAIVNETLYYKGRSGVCAYDGSLPVEASYALGNEAYSDAVGGSHGNKYYISMKAAGGNHSLFVLDTARGMWHREDDLQVSAFCSCRGELYAVSGGRILTMCGPEATDTEPVEWMAQTGPIGITTPDQKYISRLTVRMSMAVGAEVRLFAQYDSMGAWEPLCAITGTSLRSFSVPIRPRRCDHMKLRIQGVGDARIYAITKTLEQGSELS